MGKDCPEQALLYALVIDETFGNVRVGRGRTALCRFGGDCYAYGLLTSDHCDLAEEGRQAYDFMAPVCVVEPRRKWSRGRVGASGLPEGER